MRGYNCNETCRWETQCGAGAGRVRVRVVSMSLDHDESFLTIMSGAGRRVRRGMGSRLNGEVVDVDGASAVVELSSPGSANQNHQK